MLSELRRRYNYNPETGFFTWKIKPSGGGNIGSVAGTKNKISGYVLISVGGGRQDYAHRMAWLYVHGVLPKSGIDHINGQRDDNRIYNLREANQVQNCANTMMKKNNTSGYKGVHKFKATGKFQAKIWKDGVQVHLGYFSTATAAAIAYDAAAVKLSGEFAKTNLHLKSRKI